MKNLSPPTHRSAIVQRQDLLERLQAGEDKKLTLIEGPGGFGKTTLAVSWRQRLMARGNAAAWIDLTEDDDDESKLYQYFISSLVAAGCPISEGIMSLYRKTRSSNDRILLQAIADEVGQFGQQIYLFIDDFHFLSKERVTAGILAFLELSPDNLHFVFLSRTTPRVRLTPMELDEQLNLITANDLRFKFTDVKSFLEKRTGRLLDADLIQNVCNATEGWAAAIQMVSISLSKGQAKEQYDFGAGADRTEDVIILLANETFEILPRVTQNFLKSICILERFCADLGNFLTGRSDAAEIIDELIQQNYFVIPLESADGWYRLHHLYTQFLRSKIVDDIHEVSLDLARWMQDKGLGTNFYYGPAFMRELSDRTGGILNLRDLHRRAGTWLSEHGYTSDAITHIIQAGDESVAVQLLEHCAWDLIAAGRMGYLLSCMDGLQRRDIDESRLLLEAKGFAHFLTCDIRGARDELERLDKATQDLDPERVFAKETLRSGIGLYADDAAATMTVLRCWPPKGDPFVKGGACNIVMWGKIFSGQYSEARILASYARTEEDTRESYFPKVYRHCFSGLIKEHEGGLDEAESQYREALRLSEQTSGRRSAPACVAASYLSGLLYERRKLEECAGLLRGRYDLFEEMLLPDGLLRATVVQARLNWRDGQPDSAAQLIQRLEKYAADRQLVRILAATLSEKARVWLLLSAVDAANEVVGELQRCIGRAALHEKDEVYARLWMTIAKLALFNGEAGSEAGLAHCQERFESTPSVRDRLEAALACAQFRLAARDMAEAIAWARRAVELARAFGFESTVDDHLIEMHGVPDSQSFFAAYVSGAGLEPYADQALQSIRGSDSEPWAEGPGAAAPDGAEAVPLTPVESLTARELEIVGLVARGHTSRHIGSALFITENTVKYHLKNVFDKLAVNNRRAAVHKARMLKMI